MSDPVTNVEIEDVLSSIRRLVSEDSRPRTARREAAAADRLVLTPSLRVQNQDPPASETGQGTDSAPVLLTNPTSTGSPDREAEASERLTQPFEEAAPSDKPASLLAQMVEQEVARALAEEPDADDAEADEESSPRGIADWSQAQVAEPRDAPNVQAPMDLGAFAQPSEAHVVPEEEAVSEIADASGSKSAPPAEAEVPDQFPATDPALERKIKALEALVRGQAEPSSEGSYEAALVEDTSAQVLDLNAQATIAAEAAPEAPSGSASLVQDTQIDEEAAADLVAADPAPDAIETVQADVDAPALDEAITDTPKNVQEMPRFVRRRTPDVLDWEDHIPTDASASEQTDLADPPVLPEQIVEEIAPPEAQTAQGAVGEAADTAPIIDEAMLRDMVSDIVREELQGVLGERITRNVRKLVRREIHRVMMTQDFD